MDDKYIFAVDDNGKWTLSHKKEDVLDQFQFKKPSFNFKDDSPIRDIIEKNCDNYLELNNYKMLCKTKTKDLVVMTPYYTFNKEKKNELAVKKDKITLKQLERPSLDLFNEIYLPEQYKTELFYGGDITQPTGDLDINISPKFIEKIKQWIDE